jgi:magnesium transporter
MHIFDTQQLTHFEVAAEKFAREAPPDFHAGRYYMVRKSELKAVHDYFNFDRSTLIDTEVIDEAVRYTVYKDYDFISLLFICAPDGSNEGARDFPEFNIYLFSDCLVLCLPDDAGSALEGAAANLLTRLDGIITKGDEHISWLNRMLYITLDTFIASQARYLEGLEDEVEDLLDEVTALKKPTDNMFERIRHLRRTVYATMKAMRATGSVSDALTTNESDYILPDEMHLFRSIVTRTASLTSLATSIYALTEGLLHTYEAKITDRTNDAVTRLTCITIIMAVWTTIAGIYGMNFTHIPGLKNPFAFFIVLGVLVAATIVMIGIFHHRKLL